MSKPTVMSQDELKELQDAVASVSVQDIHLGRVLNLIATHLARLNDLDYPVKQEEALVEQPAQEGSV